MRILLRSLAIFWCLFAWAATAAAADLPPAWTLVPEETIALARLPNVSAFFAALRKQTKFGSVVLSEERSQGALAALRETLPGELDEITKELDKFDLKPEDYLGLFTGEVGYAVVAESREKRRPLFVGLAWLEPEGDLSERIVKAVETRLEEADEEHGPKRVDIDLAGQSVMQITFPVMAAEKVDVEFPDDEDLTPEKLRKWQEERQKREAEAEKIQVDQMNVLVARVGRRLLVANTFSQSQSEIQAKLASDDSQKIDFSDISGLEQATGVFARFLEAHAGHGNAATPRMLDVPGLQAALPDGIVLLELVADPRPALKLVEAAEPRAAAVLTALGLDGLGPLAVRGTLDGTTTRTGVFLSAPWPRNGVLALVDQQALAPEPPAWVPATAVDYTQYSFDLGKAYTLIKELAIDEGGERVKQGFEQAEQLAQIYVQTDIGTLLSSLGQQHSVVSFAPQLDDEGADEHNQQLVGGFPLGGISERVGVVWQLKDEAIWKRVMQLLGPYAVPPNLEAVEEQGFSGFRLHVPNLPIEGVFLGRGYLVLGIGKGVVESILSVLRTPPEGEAALRGSPVVTRAEALMKPQAGLSYQVGDASSSIKATRKLVLKLIDSLEQEAEGAEQEAEGAEVVEGAKPLDPSVKKALAAKLRALVPSDEELEGVIGVSTGQTLVTDHGLQSESLTELPAP